MHDLGAAPTILAFGTLDSTNAEARRRAEAGEAGPLWITAQRQTAGVGRRGRAWETGQGNLAATLLTTTAKPPTEAAQISFVAALAVADLAQGLAPAHPAQVKWPNDVLIEGRKISGILVETGEAHGRRWLAVGIGVNLKTPPESPERPAASLAEFMTTAPPPPERAVESLAAYLAAIEAVWRDQGFAPIAAEWTRRAYGLGQPCHARLPNETLEGVAEALEPDGALRLRLADGSGRRVTAGDVFFDPSTSPTPRTTSAA